MRRFRRFCLVASTSVTLLAKGHGNLNRLGNYRFQNKLNINNNSDPDLITDHGNYNTDGKWSNDPHPDGNSQTGVVGAVNSTVETVKSVGETVADTANTIAKGVGASRNANDGKSVTAEEHLEHRRQENRKKHEKHYGIENLNPDRTTVDPDPATMAREKGISSSSNSADAIVKSDATPYISASCEEICNDQCVPTTLYEEVSDGNRKTMHVLDGYVPKIVNEIGEEIGEYFGNVGRALVPGMFLYQKSVKKNKKKHTATIGISKAKTVKTSSKFLQNNKFNNKFQNQPCVSACQNMIHQCADQLDVSDAIPQEVENFTTKPHITQCEDLMKVHFIAQNPDIIPVKWNLKYGNSPSFKQIARLTEPSDLITEEDLNVLGQCAEGGDYASINLIQAKNLASCMAGESLSYENESFSAVRKAKVDRATVVTNGHPEYVIANVTNITEPESWAVKFPPVLPSEKWALNEESFYINDIRCFEACPQVNFNGLLDKCKNSASHCSTDYVDILWQNGYVTPEKSIGGALYDMQNHHANDKALVPEIWANKSNTESKDCGMLGLVQLVSSKTGGHNGKKQEPYDYHTDPTHPLYEPHHSESDSGPAPLCKPRMCAPYPAFEMYEDNLLSYMKKNGDLDYCMDDSYRWVSSSSGKESTEEVSTGMDSTEHPLVFEPVLNVKGVEIKTATTAKKSFYAKRQKKWESSALMFKKSIGM